MMGPWQHYIPGLLQRGFGIRRSGRPKEICVFATNEPPKTELITDVNADTHFYSEPSTDERSTLNAKITKYETPLADQVNAARAMQPGQRLDSNIAAKLVTHFAVRTRHVREVFGQGFQHIMRGALNEFGDPSTVQRLLGTDSLTPSDVFRDSLRDQLRKTEHASHIPESLAVQLMFQLAREHFDQFSPAALDGIKRFGAHVLENAGGLIQQAHNSALTRIIDAPEHAWDYLRALARAV